jgi:hypothetical protein
MGNDMTVSDDEIPDVRDGLTRLERTVLVVLHELRRELGDRRVPFPMLYGRVLARIDAPRERVEAIVRRFAHKT